MIVSGCTIFWGFTLWNDARGHLPWNALYIQFTTDLFQTNNKVCNLHEKSLQRERDSSSFGFETPSGAVRVWRVTEWAGKGLVGGSPASRESMRGSWLPEQVW